jgi:transcriptional regulator with XRE-family HTH domain
MTNRAKHDATTQPELGFLANHKELLAIRVRPAEFARLLGVSKQTVSTWIRDGKVTINALDGLLDVRRAIQDVLRNTSPGRLRSRVLRQAVTDALELRENLARAEDRAEAAEAALREAQKEIAHLEKWIADGDAHAETFRALLIERADELRAAPPDAWEKTLSELSDAAWDVVDPEEAADALDVAMRAIHETEGGGGE